MILQSTAQLHGVPKKIVSLVPSQTELLHWLGLEQETIGITKFCVHPPAWKYTKNITGGTKNINQDIIHRLQPDLIIANKEENIKEQVEELALHYPVWVTDVNNLDDALQMIADIGTLTGKLSGAKALVDSITNAFAGLKLPTMPKPGLKTAYLIWRNPYMAAGGGTFINDMLDRSGLENIFSGRIRYPEISIADLNSAGCQLLLLSSEPYPFKQEHIDELQTFLPQTRIITADGEMFSWYGSRLLDAPAYINQLIHSIL